MKISRVHINAWNSMGPLMKCRNFRSCPRTTEGIRKGIARYGVSDSLRALCLLAIVFFVLILASAGLNELALEKALAASPSNVRHSLKPLDLSRAPSDRELASAGQLGGELHPTHAVKSGRRHDEMNLSFGKAIEKWNRHEYREAVELFRKHVADHPDSPWAAEAKLHVGCDATYNGRYDEAEESFQSIIEANARSSNTGAKALVNKARLRLGVLGMITGDFDGARGTFAQLHAGSTDWRDRTYASNWLRELSLFDAQRSALLNCGVLALAKVLEKEGKPSDARTVSAINPGAPGGFSVEDLQALAQSLGYPLSPLRVSLADLASVPLPAIAQLSPRGPGGSGHYWVLEDLSEDGLTIFDPQSTQRFFQKKEEFSRQWSGIVLALSAREDLPGVRLGMSEARSLHGGCCGTPRASSGLGWPAPWETGPNLSGGGGCPINLAKADAVEASPSESRGSPTWQVNMINLNLFMTDTPLWYENTIGPSVAITLSYNSQSAIARHEPFGNKWQFNHGSYLVVNSAAQVTVYMPDGRRDTYTPDGLGGYSPPARVYNTLVKIAENHFELRFPDGTVHVYDIPPGTMSQQPFLVETRDVYGERLTFTYDSDVNLTGITDASGKLTELAYTPGGLVSRVTDPFGRSASFLYDANRNLTRITDMGGYWTSFSYDAGAYLTAVTSPTGTWGFFIEPSNGQDTMRTYPPPGGIMANDYRVTVTNPEGGKEEYFYGGYIGTGWYVSPRHYLPYQSATVNNYASDVPRIKYNYSVVRQTGRISTITFLDASTMQFTFDSGTGEIVKIKDRNGYNTSSTYNSMGRITSTTYPDGQVIRVSHASNGLDPTGIDNGFGTERRTYDAAHNVTSITDRLGNTTSFAYNAHGHMLSATDAMGVTTDFTHDTDQRLIRVSRGGSFLAGFEYDVIGRVVSRTDAAGLTLGFEYNDLDNIVRVSYPDGTSQFTTYSSCCPHLVDSVTDRAGRTTSFTHNARKRLTAVTHPDGTEERYAYDVNMNLASATDPTGNTTTFALDSMDRPIRQTDPVGNTTTFAYDANGNRTTITDAAGKITRIGYSSRNRPVSVTDPAGSVTTYAYDLRGLTTREIDPLQKVTSLLYDANGRPTAKTDRNGATLAYAHTPAGMPSSITYPGGARVSFTYDSLGRLTGIQDPAGASSYTYDQANRLSAFTDPNGFTIGYAYDELGNLTRLTYPDGTEAAYTYDVLNRLSSVTDGSGNTATYTYDPAGRVAIFTNLNGIVTTYTYDAAGRLIGMESIVSTHQYTLDANGNRIHSTQEEPLAAVPPPAATSYGYNARKNRLVSAGSTNYAYDAEGQLASTGATPYTFDHNHRLTQIGNSAQFTYDAGGNRLSAVRGGVTTRYIYDPWGNLLAEADSSNRITRKYLHGHGLLALTTSSATLCYHFDGTGNTIALTDMTQTIVNKYAYDPFGAVLREHEATPQPFKFVGRFGVMAEPEGLYYMRARYYDPDIGRFISEDPLGFGGGDVNLTVYVSNDPVNRVDPHGLRTDIALFTQGDVRGSKADFFSHAPTGPDLHQLLWYKLQDMFYTNLLGRGQEVLYGEIPILGSVTFTGRAAQELTHDVYLGFRDGEAVYAGITKDVARRACQHGDRFDSLQKLTNSQVTKDQARAIEQILINQNPQFENLINSIATTRSWYDEAVQWGRQWLSKLGI